MELAGTCSADDGAGEGPRPVNVELIENRKLVSTETGDDVPIWDMLFSLSDLAGRFEMIMRSWFAEYNEIKPLYDLYFSTLRNPGMYVEQRFLNMFQALESFDRRSKDPIKRNTEEHKQKVERVLGALSSDDRGWLEPKLKYSYEPSAQTRIRSLVTKYKAKWLISDAQVELAVMLRNYYTHFDPDLEPQLPPNKVRHRSLHNLGVRLQLLCEVILLTSLRFSAEEIRKQFERTRRFQKRAVEDLPGVPPVTIEPEAAR